MPVAEPAFLSGSAGEILYHISHRRVRVARLAQFGGAVLSRTFPDGEAGYPGEVAARVTYTITAENVSSTCLNSGSAILWCGCLLMVACMVQDIQAEGKGRAVARMERIW